MRPFDKFVLAIVALVIISVLAWEVYEFLMKAYKKYFPKKPKSKSQEPVKERPVYEFFYCWPGVSDYEAPIQNAIQRFNSSKP